MAVRTEATELCSVRQSFIPEAELHCIHFAPHAQRELCDLVFRHAPDCLRHLVTIFQGVLDCWWSITCEPLNFEIHD